MKAATITRVKSTDEGTFGLLEVEGYGWNCRTGELPWHDNHPKTSCIPEGEYICRWINSPKHGPTYQVMNVPDRDMIEIHSANYCGDADCGKKCELLGCIALGTNVGLLDGQMAVLNSKMAVAEFNRLMGGEDFKLIIKSEQ